ncbi:insulin-like growth factor-binding protein complex acid labile subunit [Eupeodes corollae]|uniref:insulin-like growth factor-binding protein complex acid labile subunit n=1 Tax=Eupeodes corollae TaxID=290404 RepID=UPI0024914D3A|nr:insulin-like growth factor-binding protein complex acid labile subunit [Eupeodes corollae]
MQFEWTVILSIGLFCTLVLGNDEVHFKCDESESNYESQEAFCTVSGFYVTHSQHVKMMNYTRANMTKFMKFYDSRLLYLPFKLFEHFPNLRTLDVSFTEILDITRNTFASANSLSYLNMSNNNITTIGTSVFNGANSLIRIDLSRNAIKDVNEFSFRGLPKVDKIVLSYNKISNLSKDIFVENQYLEVIALDNNLLGSLDPEVFSRLRRIREINLSNNQLLSLHPSTFQMAYGIETLLLSGNKLTDFNLEDKNILLRLHLDGNQLTSLVINSTKVVRAENNTISSITALNANFLEKLVLGRNNFTDISNITNITSLLVLDLSYNQIGPLNITSFEKLRRLKELYLRSTNISQISFGMFSKQTALETLDLSFNNLTDLNLNIFFPYMSKIKNFYVDGNNLTEIHGIHFAYAFPNLVKVGLSKNRFNCSYLHTILSPPFLSGFVELHIEPETSTEESTHIRDITCTSTKHNDGAAPKIQEESEIDVLRNTINQLKVHEKRLELYLLGLKIVMIILSCAGILAIVMIVVKYAKRERRRYSGQFGRNGSIVFRSNVTMNTSMDH